MANENWKPDIEFYAQDEHSWAIRSTCIAILNILERVTKLKSRSANTHRSDILNLYADLERLDGLLCSLEITKHMHPEIIINDDTHPNLVAEWLAGQLQPWTGPDLDNLTPNTIKLLIKTFHLYFDIIPPQGI